MTPKELAIVLAALRRAQERRDLDGMPQLFGHEPIDYDDDIDYLCEELNTMEVL